jgi:hypothetical protein
MVHLGWIMLEIQQNTWGAVSKPECTQLVCFNYTKMYMAEQHYKMWGKSARTSMLRTLPPPLQLPGMQSVPIVGVIHGGIYGLYVFPIPLHTREKTCEIKCRKGLSWWVTTWAWNYSLWYRQTVERNMFKSTRLKTWFKWVTERHQSNYPLRWCTSR